MKKKPQSTYKVLWGLIKEHKLGLILFSVASLAFNFFPVILPLFVKEIIDSLVAGKPFESLFPIFGLYALVEVVRHLAFFFSDYMYLRMFMRVRNTLYEKIYGKFLSFSLGQHRSSHSGVKISIIERGIQYFINLLSDTQSTVFPSVVRLIGIVTLLFFVSPVIALILTLTLIIHFVSWKIFNKRFFREKVKISEKMYRGMEAHKHEVIHNIESVKTTGLEKKEIGVIKEKLLKIFTFVLQFRIPLFTFRTIRSILTQLIYIGVLVWSAWLVTHGAMTAGTIVLLAQWTATATQDIIAITGFETRLADGLAALEKLANTVSLKSSLKPVISPLPFPNKTSIEFDNVSFRYDAWEEIDEEEETTTQSKLLLKDLSLSIEEGKTIAFVGPSGSGKSTLIRLLLRYFDPEKGEIRIGGAPLTQLDPEDYYKHIGYIPQQIELFSGTLRENIAYGHPHPEAITSEEFEVVMERSRIMDFAERLTEGLDTKVGEDGVKLSGGERQRVAIARALIKNPSIFIFDEATSSLDSKSESAIQEAIKDISQGKTTLVIAHRLSTIVRADTIVVIENGRVVAQGKHTDLIKHSKLYFELVKTQLSSLLEAQTGHLSEEKTLSIMRDLQLIS